MTQFEPQVFGHYYLLEHIAYGGMADIYRAKSFGASGFERELALKRVLRKLTDNPDFLQMLTNEAKLTATLQHGNIAQVFELGLLDDTYFITMEFIEGQSLLAINKLLRANDDVLSPQEACYVAYQVCTGLDYAHRRADPMGKRLNIVHCDISPDNVVLGFDGNAKVLDFGIARAQASFSNYKEGMVMGKFNYVSPEQAMGLTVDNRADIFSTAIVLYEMLTGEHPFGRKGDVTTLIRIAKFEKGEVIPPNKIKPALSQELSDMVIKAMSHRRDDRFASAGEFGAALMKYLQPATETQLREQLVGRIQGLFGAHIEKRREIRAKDEAIIRSLQRSESVAETMEDRSTTGHGLEVTREPSPTRFLWPAGAVVLGLALAFGLAPMLAPAQQPILFVHSDPAGATVKLEHEERGETPLVLELEADRPYLLEISMEGFESFQDTFTPSGKIVTRTTKLIPKLATLIVNSDPVGARAIVDGKPLGKTPAQVSLPVGSTVKVEVRYKGVSETRTITLDERGSTLKFVFKADTPRRPPKRRRRRR